MMDLSTLWMLGVAGAGEAAAPAAEAISGVVALFCVNGVSDRMIAIGDGRPAGT